MPDSNSAHSYYNNAKRDRDAKHNPDRQCHPHFNNHCSYYYHKDIGRRHQNGHGDSEQDVDSKHDYHEDFHEGSDDEDCNEREDSHGDA
ncbi:uncharacterized protein N0V89_000388 [Didymosphaeria variabile]|uniref:Uncharacterized protein n=1 Tax=Didymosphaeria variabile TaxID=1932322 RepID=A0A9W8XWP3_9PLEO|nr:uncharacterized protein N0V89_000388 [Didymosphaeria variabile]KAJ4359832.1 hypothetical protein N0V89_000388 [Didymosphaeria variabile]